MNYAFEHNGQAYSPDGKIETNDVNAHNREQERQEIVWLETHPENCTLYVHIGQKRDPNRLGSRLTDGGLSQMNGDDVQIQTWLGTRVAQWEYIGPRVRVGFGGAYRRAVTCKLFGVKYHGWFYESSGDYCRLKKSKRQ